MVVTTANIVLHKSQCLVLCLLSFNAFIGAIDIKRLLFSHSFDLVSRAAALTTAAGTFSGQSDRPW